MRRIFHLSADYPDPIEEAKTQAVRTLIELVGSRFDHTVVSLNRVSPRWDAFVASMLKGLGRPEVDTFSLEMDAGRAMQYHAPAKGIFHRTMLLRLGDQIAGQIDQGSLPQLLVGHKLTVEGFVVARMAQRLGLPYALTIQGDTDCKILKLRPDLIPSLRRIFHGAAMVCSFSPWALEVLNARLGRRAGKTFVVPCPTELDQPLAPDVAGTGLLSVFHLKSHKRKNLRAMAGALTLLEKQGRPTRLAVVGGGSPTEFASARQAAAGCNTITFEGALARTKVPERMNRASAFLLPSHRETFGLVFVEALFAGCPIIYPRGRAVDGFFDDLPFAIAVDPADPFSIADAILQVEEGGGRIKAALADWQVSPDAERFTRPQIAMSYAKALEAALA